MLRVVWQQMVLCSAYVTLVLSNVNFIKGTTLRGLVYMYNVFVDYATGHRLSFGTLNARMRSYQLSYAQALFRENGFHFERKVDDWCLRTERFPWKQERECF